MPTKTSASTSPQEAKGVTFDAFMTRAKTRTRNSRYRAFILDMAAGKVYDASASFPGIKTDTLRGALYGAAKKAERSVKTQEHNGSLYIALTK